MRAAEHAIRGASRSSFGGRRGSSEVLVPPDVETGGFRDDAGGSEVGLCRGAAGHRTSSQGDLLRIESSASGDLALRDVGTREPLETVSSREVALFRAVAGYKTALREAVAVFEAEEGVER